MTDNLVAAMKPEIRFNWRNIKKEDIKNYTVDHGIRIEKTKLF